ncbi:hypothetical protein LJC20_00495 [Eubacteriales bacterium OttesenSCG-928-M02]|nr:hypothetical protein [Eubacteriales bacterium OttesenSCG-928-M02]
MESSVLKIINTEMGNMGLNYEYDEFTKELVYPYFVGEFSENEYSYEDGSTRGEVILICFHRGTRAEMLAAKELIKDKFRDYRLTTDKGAIHIGYSREMFLRTGEADLKRMEIYLDVSYWKGER